MLAQPIIGSYAKPTFTPQTAYISPRLDMNPGYFDWLGAATHVADRHSSAMHGNSFLLDTGYAGIDAENLYCRLDFMEKTSEWFAPDTRLVLSIESGPQSSSGHSRTFRLEAWMNGPGISNWIFVENGNSPPAPDGVPNGILVRLRNEQNFECRIPLQALNAPHGALLRVRFSIWRDHLPVDALPQEGSIEVPVVSEGHLSALAYAKP